jgi:outer membrane usher protein FimD/PapC
MSVWNDSVILDPSISDFSVGLGRLDQPDRGETLAFTSFYRRGLTQRLTAGAGVDIAGAKRMAQVEGAARVGAVALSAQSAASSDGHKAGLAASTSIRHFVDLGPDRVIESYASASTVQRGFSRPLDRAPRANRARIEGEAGVLYRDRVNALSASVSRVDGAAGPTRILDVDGQRSVGRWSFGAGFRFEDRAVGKGDIQGRLRVILRAGKPSAPVTITATDRGLEARADRFGDDRAVGSWNGSAVVRSLTVERTAALDGSYEANRFRLTARHSTSEPKRGPVQRQTSATIASSIAFADGAVAIGRPVQDSFLILKRHPSLSKATATISDGASLGAMILPGAPKVEPRLYARSGLFGPPVVNLRAYQEESYDLTAENAPDGYDFGSIDPRTVGASGKGYVVRLGTDNWRAAVGELRTPEGPVKSLRIAAVRLDDPNAAPRSGFTNAGGRFYLDGLTIGRYAIRIGDVDVARFEIKPDAAALTDLGVLHAAPF